MKAPQQPHAVRAVHVLEDRLVVVRHRPLGAALLVVRVVVAVVVDVVQRRREHRREQRVRRHQLVTRRALPEGRRRRALAVLRLVAVRAVVGRRARRLLLEQPEGAVRDVARVDGVVVRQLPVARRDGLGEHLELAAVDGERLEEPPGWSNAAKSSTWAASGGKATVSPCHLRRWAASPECGGQPRAFRCSLRSPWRPAVASPRRPL